MPGTRQLRARFLLAVMLSMALANGIALWKARVPMEQAYGDFAAFYTAGVMVRSGQGSDLYDRGAQWKVQQRFAAEAKKRQGPLLYVRPPFEALLFALLAVWPFPKALIIWTGFKVVLLLAAAKLLRELPAEAESGLRKPLAALLPLWMIPLALLATFPGFMDLLMGQDAVVLLFLLAICLAQLMRGNDVIAGVVLGLALFKFHFAAALLVVLWFAGRRKVLPGFLASACFVGLLSALVTGWRGVLEYPGYLLAMNRAGGAGFVSPQHLINLRGLLTPVLGAKPYPGPVHWLLLPVALAALIYAGLLWKRAGRASTAQGFGCALAVAIVTSYYAYDYDLLLLAVPVLAMNAVEHFGDVEGKTTRYLEIPACALLLCSPLYWILREDLHAEYLMALPLIALAIAWARRLNQSGVEQPAPTLDRAS